MVCTPFERGRLWRSVIRSVQGTPGICLPSMRRGRISGICRVGCRCVVAFGFEVPCFGPLTGYRPASGGRLVFSSNKSENGIGIRIPCGQCVGCRLERARQWTMRIMHEKRLHSVSSFLTLTYDNDHLPLGGTLVKRDLQLFFKRLRKVTGDGLRFFACGEYGDFNLRPHYHALLLNFDFMDKLRIGENARGDVLYTSKKCSELWPQGHNWIGTVTVDSAAYVARYVMKKMTGDKAQEYYTEYDSDGRCYERLPEFTVMSRRPGIGTGWYDKYGEETYVHDSVVLNGREVRPASFYDAKVASSNLPVQGTLRQNKSAQFDEIQRKRRRKAVVFRADRTKERLRVREMIVLKRLQQLKRNI
ncbi:replication initiator protein [Blackfly microvirus SF02]|uniref:Replication initiator protein n=1 Tax=Blackfly microvirus SF02 TaxID=2576452 RepID=A0A4P8PT97_9VIRU|nr:replication initiator protein [Blackfly microvirus SF02]